MIYKILALLGFSCFLFAQTESNINIGKKEIIFSKALNENRTLWIYTPNQTSQSSDTNKSYPVIYVFDGEAQFYSTVGMVQQLSQANGNGMLPEMIVVGIENTNRLRDLVPSNQTAKPNPFINFISEELMPYINKNYKTAPYNVLIGHSLGGLTVIDVLTNHTQLFNAYIAIDPSMWFDNEKVLSNSLTNLKKQNLQNKRLYIGIANTLPKEKKITKLKNDKNPDTKHIRSIFKLDSFLKSNSKDLAYHSKYYENETHNSAPLITIYDGLRFIFDYYLFDVSENDFSDTTNLIALKLKKHYKNVSEKMNFQNTAPEPLINFMAYDALAKMHYQKAKALFELNMEWYPNSSKVYDGYADYYLTTKDTTNAVSFYQKSLKIKENFEVKRKLETITKKNNNIEEAIDLQKYQGIYILEKYNIPIVLEVRDRKLFAKVPGQTDDEFVPVSKDVFTVKGKQGYTITFKCLDNKPLEFTSVQPNGTFKAIFKNE